MSYKFFLGSFLGSGVTFLGSFLGSGAILPNSRSHLGLCGKNDPDKILAKVEAIRWVRLV